MEGDKLWELTFTDEDGDGLYAFDDWFISLSAVWKDEGEVGFFEDWSVNWSIWEEEWHLKIWDVAADKFKEESTLFWEEKGLLKDDK